jgi:hypothetical protein
MSTQDGITYMGYMIIAITATLVFVYFPMWGGMLLPPKQVGARCCCCCCPCCCCRQWLRAKRVCHRLLARACCCPPLTCT